jgi:eukaryotic-like serine/threonine-protein kinase
MKVPSHHDPARLRRISALLDTALDLQPALRQAWLAGLPAEDQSLRLTLQTLLARAEVQTDDFLRPLALADPEADGAADAAGARIGPYRLVQVLGEGGMATVWLAERDSEGDGGAGVLRRTVALKLPAPGLGAGLARRVGRERDLLATLEHPRIARLYEAGVTPEGRPWLAMERVEGLPPDLYCQGHALDVDARLRLFLQVAEAVAYAHGRLVVHRDLKPANILVTAQGDVRLLDFGIAALLQGDAGATDHHTNTTAGANTPDYAWPEQVAGHPVSVSTDVYSLGVVLFELLTGRRPYALKRHSMAALEEAILNADVPLPSISVGGDRRLARRLAGDLDTIVTKALRKPAALRYASVEAMAADVQRHLRGEPVLAEGIGNDESITRAELLQRSRRFVARAATPLARAMGADQLSALYLSYGNHRDAESLLARALAELPQDTEPGVLRTLRCKQSHAWSRLSRRAESIKQLDAVTADPPGDAMSASYCLRLRATIAHDENQAEAALRFATAALRRLDEVDLDACCP